MEKKVERLIGLAQRLCDETPDFLETKGPGRGDHAAIRFMDQLQIMAKELFGRDFSQARICGNNNFTPDFYFPDERTIVEIAFGLSKPISEFERDIFKCLLAKDSGQEVDKLIFVTKPGGDAKVSAPGPMAIREWALEKCKLEIEVWELHPRNAP